MKIFKNRLVYLDPLIDIFPIFEVTIYKLFYKLDYLTFNVSEAKYSETWNSFRKEFNSQLCAIEVYNYSCTILMKLNRNGKFEKVFWTQASLELDRELFISLIGAFKFKEFSPSTILGLRITSYIKVNIKNRNVMSLEIIPCPYKHTFFVKNQIPFILK